MWTRKATSTSPRCRTESACRNSPIRDLCRCPRNKLPYRLMRRSYLAAFGRGGITAGEHLAIALQIRAPHCAGKQRFVDGPRMFLGTGHKAHDSAIRNEAGNGAARQVEARVRDLLRN